MSIQNKFKQDKGVSQADQNSHESQNDIKRGNALPTDYYSEWAIEKSSFEKPKSGQTGNSVNMSSGKGFQHRNIIDKYKWANGNGETNVSTSYNEIYNQAELFNFP